MYFYKKCFQILKFEEKKLWSHLTFILRFFTVSNKAKNSLFKIFRIRYHDDIQINVTKRYVFYIAYILIKKLQQQTKNKIHNPKQRRIKKIFLIIENTHTHNTHWTELNTTRAEEEAYKGICFLFLFFLFIILKD